MMPDTKEILKGLEKLGNAKVITVLILIGVVAFFVYKNFDFITEITFKVDRNLQSSTAESDNHKKEEKSLYSTLIKINKTWLTPTSFDIPSSLYFEVLNYGANATKDTTITIDLGRAQIVELDWNPKVYCSIESEIKGKSVINITCTKILGAETIYVQSLISSPIFRKIAVTSAEMPYPKHFSYDDIDKKPEGNVQKEGSFFSESFIGFLKFILAGVIVAFSYYFVLVVVTLINRWLKI